MIKKNRIWILLIILPLVFYRISESAGTVQGVYNGESVYPVRMFTANSTLYFSLRDITKLCSAKLLWYSITGKVVLQISNNKIGFFYGTKRININGKKIVIDKSILMVSDNVYIPLDFLQSKQFEDASRLKISYNYDTKIFEAETVFNVLQPRLYENRNYIKIVFELTEPLQYNISRKPKNSMLLEFFKAHSAECNFNYKNSYFKKIDINNNYNKVECRFDLSSQTIKIYNVYKENPYPQLVLYFYNETLPDIAKSTETLVMDTTGTCAVPAAPINVSSLISYSEKNIDESPVPAIQPAFIPAESKKKYCIVLDAGHGGDDPGAVGTNGTKEKDINLNIVKELESLLLEEGYTVLLTRKDDTFIPLMDRTQFANDGKADIFVSIHCNASIKKDTKGYEIYFLSERASDASAEATETLENSVVKLEGKPTHKKMQLRDLLWSMVVNEFMNESSEISSYITDNIVKRIKIENRGIKQAGFYVLRGTQMPAVLVECAFISNAAEESKLRTRQFQAQISDAIYSGIKNFAVYKETKKE